MARFEIPFVRLWIVILLSGFVMYNDWSSIVFSKTRVFNDDINGKAARQKPEAKLEETICANWDTDMDSFWTHNPDWRIEKENETHQCFRPMHDKKKAAFFRQLYDAQFSGDCSDRKTIQMTSAGWGADFFLVSEGLLYAYENKLPVAVYPRLGRWHYAAKKDASNPVCPRKDMSCYFLNITSCQADPENIERLKPDGDPTIHSRKGKWLYEYATRPQTWLRREVYKLSSSTHLKTPCTVMHVRRTDVVLHKGKRRKYHEVKEYVDAVGENITQNIFLLTDDQNAIEEAEAQFPQFNWMYMDRPRYRGLEGGWEQQLPSDDPKFEAIVILSTMKLVQNCETFVYGRSRFASQIRESMPDAKLIYIDEGKEIFNENFGDSVNISTPFSKNESVKTKVDLRKNESFSKPVA